jgi:hypothetical protein
MEYGDSSVFELCTPRQDVEKGTISESDYAANLANILTGIVRGNLLEQGQGTR